MLVQAERIVPNKFTDYFVYIAYVCMTVLACLFTHYLQVLQSVSRVRLLFQPYLPALCSKLLTQRSGWLLAVGLEGSLLRWQRQNKRD
jgi:hypothetical protein